MNIILWILQALAAGFFLLAGSMKLVRPIDELAKRFEWISNVPPWFVRFIGACELAGAVGLIVPAVTSILPKVTLVAAAGLAALMACAVVFHVARRELPASIRALVILVVALVITTGRWMLVPA